MHDSSVTDGALHRRKAIRTSYASQNVNFYHAASSYACANVLGEKYLPCDMSVHWMQERRQISQHLNAVL